jgi:hypothetical protein
VAYAPEMKNDFRDKPHLDVDMSFIEQTKENSNIPSTLAPFVRFIALTKFRSQRCPKKDKLSAELPFGTKLAINLKPIWGQTDTCTRWCLSTSTSSQCPPTLATPCCVFLNCATPPHPRPHSGLHS